MNSRLTPSPGKSVLPVLSPAGVIDHPPIAPLLPLLERLRAANLPHALGSSALLAALGLVERVNDWDVTVDATIEQLEAACAGLDFVRHGHGGGHADHKLSFAAERSELIADFAFFVEGGIVRIPSRVTATWQGLPIGSPTAWAVAYALLAEAESSERRRERSERLFRWAAQHAPETEVREALLSQPLPETIARRLRATATG